MSACTDSDVESESDIICCAACSITEVDGIKLKKCNDYDLVRYCSVTCEQVHRPQHEVMCKKRAAELRDIILFRQPESSDLGDCPICLLPLSLDPSKTNLMTCCSKLICDGCAYAATIHHYEGSLQEKCPFCRHTTHIGIARGNKNIMKRIEANDPVAMSVIGLDRYEEGDYNAAVDYCTKASELGDAAAHYVLSCLYDEGKGVEKDVKKKEYHREEAAISGHPKARHNLGCIEFENCRPERAVKHWIIAAKLGFDLSLNALKECYRKGLVSKEDFAASLRGHQTAVDATKSPQRDQAEAFIRESGM